MNKHTAGPWTHSQIINEECDLTAKGGTFLGINTGQGAPDRLDASDYAEFEANVQLIAAAPELLEALEALVQQVEIHNAEGAFGEDYTNAQDAIAKARGTAV